jgi:glycosyltransferase involved in cell wall biosynthesis
MRVAVFTDNDFDRINGVTTALTALLDHAPTDISPRIYTASALGVDAPHYLALPSFPVPVPFNSEMAIYLPRYREYLRRVRIDEVGVLHLTTPGPMGLVALWIAAQTGLPLVGSFHTDLGRYSTILSGSSARRLMAPYLRWVYGRCARTLVPSISTRELLIDSGVSAARVGLWRRGVDANHFTPSRRTNQWRTRWRVGNDELVLLYVGRISQDKGLEMLPEMLYRLRTLRVAHRMVIAGDGPLRKSLAEQLPEAIFTGWLGREDVADVFASGDLFVFPSTTDGAGSVVLEAQASGLPVVVAEAGGAKEQMLPEVTGVVCHDAGPKQWAHLIAAVSGDLQRRRELARAARAYASGRTWDYTLAALYQSYRDVSRNSHRLPVAHAADRGAFSKSVTSAHS